MFVKLKSNTQRYCNKTVKISFLTLKKTMQNTENPFLAKTGPTLHLLQFKAHTTWCSLNSPKARKSSSTSSITSLSTYLLIKHPPLNLLRLENNELLGDKRLQGLNPQANNQWTPCSSVSALRIQSISTLLALSHRGANYHLALTITPTSQSKISL